jgi:hypothetical protein
LAFFVKRPEKEEQEFVVILLLRTLYSRTHHAKLEGQPMQEASPPTPGYVSK